MGQRSRELTKREERGGVETPKVINKRLSLERLMGVIKIMGQNLVRQVKVVHHLLQVLEGRMRQNNETDEGDAPDERSEE